MAAILAVPSAAHARPKTPRISALRVQESITLPAVEISGLAWRKNPETARRELLFVSDRERKLYVLDWEKRKTAPPREISLGDASSALEGATQSEWESVFSDSSGRVFIIQESPAEMLVVAADLSKIESRIRLAVAKPAADREAWERNDNSGGEGFVPLRNGHVLVTKEKNPLKIFEFAPKGKSPEGYRAEFSIESEGRFPSAPPAEYVSAASWTLSPELEALFEDSSGINSDARGRLYLLGDQRNLIGRLAKTLKTEQPVVKVDRLWSIPSEIRQPEGMVIDEENRPILAIDRKNTKKPNLFVLSPMETGKP